MSVFPRGFPSPPAPSTMYQLLGLVAERGSGGVVDKVVISQESVGDLVRLLSPGAYGSITDIDFAALDSVLLKPVGVYGSESAILHFLARMGHSLPHITGEGTGHRLPTGLYYVLGQDEGPHTRRGYVVYWPEPTTWDDSSISSVKRNRVTFMRYLTKITHQVVGLISDEHSSLLVWKDLLTRPSLTNSKPSMPKLKNRFFSFTVEKTKEQAEGVTTRPGSTIMLPQDFADQDPRRPSQLPRLVVSETRQALVSCVAVPPRWLGTENEQTVPRGYIEALLRDEKQTIELGEHIEQDAASGLLAMGLRERHTDLVHEWRRDVTAMRTAMDDSIAYWSQQASDALKADFGRLSDHIEGQVLAYVQSVHEWVSLRPTHSEAPSSSGIIKHQLEDLEPDQLTPVDFLRISFPRFQLVKSRFVVATNAIQHQPVSPSVMKTLDRAIVTGKGYDRLVAELLRGLSSNPPSKSFTGRIASTFRCLFKTGHGTVQELLRRGGGEPDPAFLAGIIKLDWQSRMPRAVEELQRLASTYLASQVASLTLDVARRMSDEQLKSAQAVSRLTIEDRFEEMEKTRYATFRADINKAEKDRRPCEHLVLVRHLSAPVITPGTPPSEEYRMAATTYTTDPAHTIYNIRPVGLTAGDVQSIVADPAFVPSPIVLASAEWSFRLPEKSTLKTEYLFANGRYLVVVVDEVDSKARFYLENDTSMSIAIKERKSARQIDLARVGVDFLVSVDEAKRIIGILSKLDNRLYIYAMDELFTTLRPRSELDIYRITDGKLANATCMALIPGKEEVAILDDNGLCRILSLVTENLKTGVVQCVKGSPHSLLCSPDGTCIFITTSSLMGEVIGVKACHVASFGVSRGFELDLSSETVFQPQITSFVTRSNAYLAFSSPGSKTLRSMKLTVTNKASDLSFRASRSSISSSASEPEKNPTLHNSLLDCFEDVWSRYPIVATISRASPALNEAPHSLCFVTSDSDKPFARYISDMVNHFQVTTKKPTNGILARINVSAVSDLSAILDSDDLHVSTFRAGRWLIELLCLIPLHLAVTDGNAFIPLKDGVRSSEFERELLGMHHRQVADAITVGWYESILRSYFADRPIRIVSSMGEQSVGKSYALNHFVDTSFAGSAMRCTEGAWLSVTPTQNEVVVALDFEGIHSIERTAQEDMLLVLFNVALSDLVLFRNNFALSRDVAGMFTSFQSSAALLGDPASHPTLFRSTLAIIIKDVVDTDSEEIAKEFADKFRRIVQEKQGENFITTLHRGQLDIIPWPVIQSEAFYTQMKVLKTRLDDKPFSHGNAATFLQTLKMLMARLKANDWASLDPNVAEGRVTILLDSLTQAFSRGFTGDDPEEGQLKSLDTHQPVTAQDIPHVFSLASDDTESSSTRDSRFLALRSSFTSSPSSPQRQFVPDAEYVASLNTQMRSLAKIRSAKVQAWLKANIARFPSDQPDVQRLVKQFMALRKELLSSVQACGSTCGFCALRCLRYKGHEGEHNCTTSHQCVHLCSLDGKVVCGFTAGHGGGRHICDVEKHLCGKTCSLLAKEGCLGVCSKSINHEGDEHLCESTNHACGLPCHLSKHGLCNLPCTIDCRQKHDQHRCKDRLQCPKTCQLCNRLCAARDHDHALEVGALHICGREHACDKDCGALGMCHVSPTALSSAQSTSRIKHPQRGNRRACAKKIPPGKLKHSGDHIHSLEPSPFHFCGQSTPFSSCDCVCELPYGHPQDHSTGHGRYEQSTWPNNSAPKKKSTSASTSRSKPKSSRGWLS